METQQQPVFPFGPDGASAAATTKHVSSGWTETVIKFESLSASQMLAHIASVRYSGNGIYLLKQIFHGTIVRVAGSELGPKNGS